jgi:tankyrase
MMRLNYLVSSLQHMDIATLLRVNACKHHRQVTLQPPPGGGSEGPYSASCALLLAYSDNPTMKKQEGQTALDLAMVRILPLLVLDSMKMSKGV